MITAVNTLHRDGLTLEAPPDDKGIDFFYRYGCVGYRREYGYRQ